MQNVATSANPSVRPISNVTPLRGGDHPPAASAPLRQRRTWTTKERAFVKENYVTKGAPWCAERLKGRTAESVRMFAFKSGFARPSIATRMPSTPMIDELIRRTHANSANRSYARIVAKAIGRGEGWVYRRATELGIATRPKASTPYSPEEEEFVLRHAHRSRAHIARLMKNRGWNRTANSIQQFIAYHGLRDNGQFQGTEALAMCLGVSTSTIKTWVKSGLLLSRERNSTDPAAAEPLRRMYDESDIARFIVQNPTKLDMRKVDGPWLIDLLARLGSRAMADGRDKTVRIAAIKDVNPGLSNAELASMTGAALKTVETALAQRRAAQRAAQAA